MTTQARKFAASAEEYDRGRPSWPREALDICSVPREATVLDLAAGTGQLTRLLVDRYEHVIAVEPLDELRALLERNVPQAEIRAGSAEWLPLDDGSLDAVFVAEAFHWFDGPHALAEAARVLRPGGLLALLWNRPDGPLDPPVSERVWELVRAAIDRGGEPGGPKIERGEWRAAFEGSRFPEPERLDFGNEFRVDREGFVANLLSISSVAGLPCEEKDELVAKLRALVPEADYRAPLRTELYLSRLRD